MGKRLKKIRIFVSSPSDVQEERDRLPKVIEELNRTIGQDKAIFLELVRWETDVTPGMGRPQEIINRQIGPYDVFIGVMWKRFGTPTGISSSGTSEEFDLAYASWKINGKPHIMFYFNKSKYFLNSAEEAEQVKRVLEFREQLQKQALIREYDGPNNFEQLIRQHLQLTIQSLIAHSNKKGKSSLLQESIINSIDEPFKELFSNAFAEWKRHRVFASQDRLELFLRNRDKLEFSREQLRFILESWFKCRLYNPEEYLKTYDKNEVVKICIDIIKNEKDGDLINGAIRVLGNQNSAECADVLLQVIEEKNKYQSVNRITAIGCFWFSEIIRAPLSRIPNVLINVLQTDPDYRLRKDSAYALKNYPTHEVIKALEEALRDSRSQVRFDVIGSLSSIKSPSSIEPLLKVLEEETNSIKMRKKIIGALAGFAYHPRVRKVLEYIAANRKEDSQVVKEAKWSLRKL